MLTAIINFLFSEKAKIQPVKCLARGMHGVMDDILKQMVHDKKSIKEIVKLTGKSKSSVSRYLKRLGLSTAYQIDRTHVCNCGQTNSNEFYKDDFSVCKKCTNIYRNNIGKSRRLYAVNKLGGKCVSCGYDQYTCSLDIHHTNPSIKDENFKNLRSWTKEKIDAEMVHCILLCKNCHSAHHAGHLISYYVNSHHK